MNLNIKIMDDKKNAELVLEQILDRIDKGEFDRELDIPFASRKLLKSVVISKMEKKLQTHATPMISESNLYDYIREVKETALETLQLFLNSGILEEDEEGNIVFPEKWEDYIEYE